MKCHLRTHAAQQAAIRSLTDAGGQRRWDPVLRSIESTYLVGARTGGLLDSYTNLENPDFTRVAEAISFYAKRVEHAEDLDAAVRDWLPQPGSRTP